MVDTLSMGGTERMSVNMAAVMEEKGWESHLIISRGGGGLESHIPKGVQVHQLNKKAFYDVFAFLRLAKLIIAHKPTIFHAHSTSIYWAVAIKVFLGRFLLVWHDHFGLSDQLDQFPRKEMVLLSKWIDKIVVVNSKLEKYWKDIFPYRSSDIRYIGNFPWLQLFPDKKFSQFTFLNLANFRPQKDQITLVRAVKILAGKGMDFKLIMVGVHVDEAWVNRIAEEIKSNQLEQWVEIQGPSGQVEQLLAKSHVGILSSVSEGLPVALLEYGLAELPVVCTDVGDCAKVIASPELGILVPKSSPESLANAMEIILKEYQSSLQMGKNLKDKVEASFGKDKFLSEYWEIFRGNTTDASGD